MERVCAEKWYLDKNQMGDKGEDKLSILFQGGDQSVADWGCFQILKYSLIDLLGMRPKS